MLDSFATNRGFSAMRTADASIKIDSGLDGYALQSTYGLENEMLFRRAIGAQFQRELLPAVHAGKHVTPYRLWIDDSITSFPYRSPLPALKLRAFSHQSLFKSEFSSFGQSESCFLKELHPWELERKLANN